MKRRTFLAATAATLAAPRLAGAQAPIELKIAAATAADHVAIFIGVERGIFARNGLDPKTQLFATGVEIINSLVANAHDVGVLGSVPPLTGIANGMPLVIIGHLHGNATSMNYSESNSIVASAASGIRENNFAALRGKRVGLPRGTGAEAHLRGILEQASLTINDVTGSARQLLSEQFDQGHSFVRGCRVHDQVPALVDHRQEFVGEDDPETLRARLTGPDFLRCHRFPGRPPRVPCDLPARPRSARPRAEPRRP